MIDRSDQSGNKVINPETRRSRLSISKGVWYGLGFVFLVAISCFLQVLENLAVTSNETYYSA